MITLFDIKGKRYPFLFDMEVVWFLTSSGKIDIETQRNEKGDVIKDEETGEPVVKITAEYDDMMELFLKANYSAIEYEGKGNELETVDLKNGIRENPKLFVDLQRALSESGAMKMFEELKKEGEEEDAKKKNSSPGKKSGK